jgi:hypothetical protein
MAAQPPTDVGDRVDALERWLQSRRRADLLDG